MALDDLRQWIDVDALDGKHGAIALELTTDGRLSVRVEEPGAPAKVAEVALDYSDTGLLIDTAREAMGRMLARAGDPTAIAAVAAIHAARDTPTDAHA